MLCKALLNAEYRSLQHWQVVVEGRRRKVEERGEGLLWATTEGKTLLPVGWLMCQPPMGVEESTGRRRVGTPALHWLAEANIKEVDSTEALWCCDT